jgi:hypothetical protein
MQAHERRGVLCNEIVANVFIVEYRESYESQIGKIDVELKTLHVHRIDACT